MPVKYEQIKERLQLALIDYNPVAETQSGDARCYLFNDTALLLRLEDSELVVVGLTGDAVETSLFLNSAALQVKGIQSIRFHTKRIALKRLLERHGIIVEQRGVDREDYYILGVNCGR
ncbi:hypothetical protein [Vibrio hyugaensis]|uniref:hypothetical protein n=1 Tax=Vibrio hyugaensis TaxID=1534743 RepID=UPI0005EE0A8F|nr:hypothetical protein [Vibrio hyugaensis]